MVSKMDNEKDALIDTLAAQVERLGALVGKKHEEWEVLAEERDSLKAQVAGLTAERDSLKAAKWDVKHTDTMNDMVAMGLARDAAEAERDALKAKLAKAEGRVVTGRNSDNEVGFEFISGDKHLFISLDLKDGLTSYTMKKGGKFVPGEHLMEMPADIVDYLRSAQFTKGEEG